jgi:hypothetical protein
MKLYLIKSTQDEIYIVASSMEKAIETFRGLVDICEIVKATLITNEIYITE